MSKSIGTHHMKAFVFIKSLIEKYGEAFPSIPTLAKVTGCSPRYMTTVMNDLVEWGILSKQARYSLNRQLSNGYEILSNPQEEIVEVSAENQEEVVSVHPIKDFIKDSIQEPLKAPIKSLSSSFINDFDDDDNYIPSEYQVIFFTDLRQELGTEVAQHIFPYVKGIINTMKPLVWHNAILQFKDNAHNASRIGPYFRAILETEWLKNQVVDKRFAG